MKFNFEKKIRILDDLLYYCHGLGATDYSVHVRVDPGATHFEVICPVAVIGKDEIARITETLNRPRQRELEQNYWGLTGEYELEGDLAMAGIMIDEAEVTYENGTLCIVARRFR